MQYSSHHARFEMLGIKSLLLRRLRYNNNECTYKILFHLISIASDHFLFEWKLQLLLIDMSCFYSIRVSMLVRTFCSRCIVTQL